ncbi:MAG: class I SAM-dependent methyltransferase [Bacteroidales bacterium]|jgi:ubiquinone/menaquinone biosynthesis C-methylase UbiE|nr:class I SAM-dependent methyltransferase [Bacteroidales bacterium]
MEIPENLKKRYSFDKLSALEAQRKAHEIAFAPVVFQVNRLMVKWGILEAMVRSEDGLDLQDVAALIKPVHATYEQAIYSAKILCESSLTSGTILLNEKDKFVISKIGFFLLNDPLVKVNMDFVNDVNYLGLFELEKSLKEGKPQGLKTFGDWATIYEGLSELPPDVQQSWFAFDHYYSDNSFNEALQIVFADKSIRNLLDIGGNTGRWALKVVDYNAEANVTVFDLPQQVAMLANNIRENKNADRISTIAGDVLNTQTAFPADFDAYWVSQFLDCFSEEQVISILKRICEAMDRGKSKLYIMETLWDRQRFETAAFCLAQTSVYFTALANGNSKMFYSNDLIRMIESANLAVETIHDNIGKGHSILVCRKK